jgi:hypothetical protein
MTTTTTEPTIASLTIKETYDKPRKCGNCGRRRKVSVIEITGDDTTDTQQLCAGCVDDLESTVKVEHNIVERYGLDGEADAILPPPQGNDDTAAAVLDGIGPAPGEELPKTFNDEIRKRVAAQHLAGASVPDLAKAWGRTASSIKAIIAKFPNG